MGLVIITTPAKKVAFAAWTAEVPGIISLLLMAAVLCDQRETSKVNVSLKPASAIRLDGRVGVGRYIVERVSGLRGDIGYDWLEV